MLYASKEKGQMFLELAIVILFIVVFVLALYQMIALSSGGRLKPIILPAGY